MNERSVSVNGISIYSLTNPNLRSFCLSLYVRAGSIFEDLSNNGISHLLNMSFSEILKINTKIFMSSLQCTACAFRVQLIRSL